MPHILDKGIPWLAEMSMKGQQKPATPEDYSNFRYQIPPGGGFAAGYPNISGIPTNMPPQFTMFPNDPEVQALAAQIWAKRQRGGSTPEEDLKHPIDQAMEYYSTFPSPSGVRRKAQGLVSSSFGKSLTPEQATEAEQQAINKFDLWGNMNY